MINICSCDSLLPDMQCALLVLFIGQGIGWVPQVRWFSKHWVHVIPYQA